MPRAIYVSHPTSSVRVASKHGSRNKSNSLSMIAGVTLYETRLVHFLRYSQFPALAESCNNIPKCIRELGPKPNSSEGNLSIRQRVPSVTRNIQLFTHICVCIQHSTIGTSYMATNQYCQ